MTEQERKQMKELLNHHKHLVETDPTYHGDRIIEVYTLAIAKDVYFSLDSEWTIRGDAVEKLQVKTRRNGYESRWGCFGVFRSNNLDNILHVLRMC